MHTTSFKFRRVTRTNAALRSLALLIVFPCVVIGQTGTPSLDEVARDISIIKAYATKMGARGHVASPQESRRPAAPTTRLYAALTILENLSKATEDRKHSDAHLRGAMKAIRGALKQYGTSRELGRVLATITKATQELHVLQEATNTGYALVDHAGNHLARAAKQITDDAVALASRTDTVDRPSLAAARDALTSAHREIELGHYAVALGHLNEGLNFVSGGPSFDIELFEQNIQDALNGQTVGHAFAIVRNGLLYHHGAEGDARTAEDPPQVDQSASKEMYIASMTKTISAVALLSALNESGLSVDESIADYLPSNWEQGSGVNTLTFRHLLTHTSGLDPNSLSANSAGGQTLETLEEIIETGTPGVLSFNNAVYTNANFSLLRILIPQIIIGDDIISIYANVLAEDYVYAALYADYVYYHVLEPANIDARFCAPDDENSERTLSYSFTSLAPGVDHGDWSLSCGATGYYLSAVELARLLATMRYTDNVIDNQTRDLMNDGFLGWLNPVTFSAFVTGEQGAYRAHGGDSATGSNPGMSGCAMNFPIYLEAVLLINSRGGSIGGHACTVLRNAYDDAWE